MFRRSIFRAEDLNTNLNESSMFTINEENLENLKVDLSSNYSLSLTLSFVYEDVVKSDLLKKEDILLKRGNNIKFSKGVTNMTKKFIDNIFSRYQENSTVKKFVTNIFNSAVRKSANIIAKKRFSEMPTQRFESKRTMMVRSNTITRNSGFSMGSNTPIKRMLSKNTVSDHNRIDSLDSNRNENIINTESANNESLEIIKDKYNQELIYENSEDNSDIINDSESKNTNEKNNNSSFKSEQEIDKENKEINQSIHLNSDVNKFVQNSVNNFKDEGVKNNITNNLFKQAPGPIEQIAIEKDNSTQPENLNYLIFDNNRTKPPESQIENNLNNVSVNIPIVNNCQIGSIDTELFDKIPKNVNENMTNKIEEISICEEKDPNCAINKNVEVIEDEIRFKKTIIDKEEIIINQDNSKDNKEEIIINQDNYKDNKEEIIINQDNYKDNKEELIINQDNSKDNKEELIINQDNSKNNKEELIINQDNSKDNNKYNEEFIVNQSKEELIINQDNSEVNKEELITNQYNPELINKQNKEDLIDHFDNNYNKEKLNTFQNNEEFIVKQVNIKHNMEEFVANKENIIDKIEIDQKNENNQEILKNQIDKIEYIEPIIENKVESKIENIKDHFLEDNDENKDSVVPHIININNNENEINLTNANILIKTEGIENISNNLHLDNNKIEDEIILKDNQVKDLSMKDDNINFHDEEIFNQEVFKSNHEINQLDLKNNDILNNNNNEKKNINNELIELIHPTSEFIKEDSHKIENIVEELEQNQQNINLNEIEHIKKDLLIDTPGFLFKDSEMINANSFNIDNHIYYNQNNKTKCDEFKELEEKINNDNKNDNNEDEINFSNNKEIKDNEKELTLNEEKLNPEILFKVFCDDHKLNSEKSVEDYKTYFDELHIKNNIENNFIKELVNQLFISILINVEENINKTNSKQYVLDDICKNDKIDISNSQIPINNIELIEEKVFIPSINENNVVENESYKINKVNIDDPKFLGEIECCSSKSDKITVLNNQTNDFNINLENIKIKREEPEIYLNNKKGSFDEKINKELSSDQTNNKKDTKEQEIKIIEKLFDDNLNLVNNNEEAQFINESSDITKEKKVTLVNNIYEDKIKIISSEKTNEKQGTSEIYNNDSKSNCVINNYDCLRNPNFTQNDIENKYDIEASIKNVNDEIVYRLECNNEFENEVKNENHEDISNRLDYKLEDRNNDIVFLKNDNYEKVINTSENINIQTSDNKIDDIIKFDSFSKNEMIENNKDIISLENKSKDINYINNYHSFKDESIEKKGSLENNSLKLDHKRGISEDINLKNNIEIQDPIFDNKNNLIIELSRNDEINNLINLSEDCFNKSLQNVNKVDESHVNSFKDEIINENIFGQNLSVDQLTIIDRNQESNIYKDNNKDICLIENDNQENNNIYGKNIDKLDNPNNKSHSILIEKKSEENAGIDKSGLKDISIDNLIENIDNNSKEEEDNMIKYDINRDKNEEKQIFNILEKSNLIYNDTKYELNDKENDIIVHDTFSDYNNVIQISNKQNKLPVDNTRRKSTLINDKFKISEEGGNHQIIENQNLSSLESPYNNNSNPVIYEDNKAYENIIVPLKNSVKKMFNRKSTMITKDCKDKPDNIKKKPEMSQIAEEEITLNNMVNQNERYSVSSKFQDKNSISDKSISVNLKDDDSFNYNQINKSQKTKSFSNENKEELDEMTNRNLIENIKIHEKRNSILKLSQYEKFNDLNTYNTIETSNNIMTNRIETDGDRNITFDINTPENKNNESKKTTTSSIIKVRQFKTERLANSISNKILIKQKIHFNNLDLETKDFNKTVKEKSKIIRNDKIKTNVIRTSNMAVKATIKKDAMYDQMEKKLINDKNTNLVTKHSLDVNQKINSNFDVETQYTDNKGSQVSIKPKLVSLQESNGENNLSKDLNELINKIKCENSKKEKKNKNRAQKLIDNNDNPKNEGIPINFENNKNDYFPNKTDKHFHSLNDRRTSILKKTYCGNFDYNIFKSNEEIYPKANVKVDKIEVPEIKHSDRKSRSKLAIITNSNFEKLKKRLDHEIGPEIVYENIMKRFNSTSKEKEALRESIYSREWSNKILLRNFSCLVVEVENNKLKLHRVNDKNNINKSGSLIDLGKKTMNCFKSQKKTDIFPLIGRV